MRALNWAAYLLAVLLTILVKLLRWMHSEKPENVSFRASLLNYFVGSDTAALSSITVFGFELLLGAVLIDHLSIGIEWIAGLPSHPVLAFFLGSISEALAPPGVRWISNKVFPGG